MLSHDLCRLHWRWRHILTTAALEVQASYHGVLLVGVLYGEDQPVNVRRAVHLEVGLAVDPSDTAGLWLAASQPATG